MQEVIQMCSFETNKSSTKGASKLRRDLINGEIANLRDLLPLPSSTRQRLSQLQLMGLICVYVRKSNYFQQVFKRYQDMGHPYNSTPNIGFSKALSGFIIMMTQNGKLLYISDNAAEYLGHSMEDLLIHGDSVYDIIDKADHATVQNELLRTNSSQTPSSTATPGGEDSRIFLCRMNVSRNARRQMRFGDQKVVLLQGHFLSYLPLCSRNEPVFVAICTPIAMPETRECVVQGATNVFTSIHAMDMKFIHIDRNAEFYLGYTRSELGGVSWYQLIHWNFMREAQNKHRLISQSEQEKSCILLLRLQTRQGDWIWVHCVLQVKDGSDSQNQQQQSVIVSTNQVLSDREATVLRNNAWLYHYYTVQAKLQYGLAYPPETPATSPSAAAAAARLAAASYFPTPQMMANYSHHHLHPHHYHHYHQHPGTENTGGYSNMPPQIPHNGAYHHPHHHHPTFEMSSAAAGKESLPLDFSLAASEFPITGYHQIGAPPPSYWTHSAQSHNSSASSHHQHYHQTHQSHTSYSANVSSNAAAAAANHGGSQRITQLSPSNSSTSASAAPSPQSWTLLPSSSVSSNSSISHSSPTSNNISPNTNVLLGVGGGAVSNTNSHINSSSNSGGGGTPRKRIKKISESVIESTTPPLNANHRSSAATNGHDVNVATMTSYPFHTRNRNVFKVLGTSIPEDDHVNIKEEPISMPGTLRRRLFTANPIIETTETMELSPPVWEGQTQRVPDLQQQHSFYERDHSHHHTMMSVHSVPDLIHCVPTYQPPYFQLSANNHMMETGSPNGNKENKSPPTSDSSSSPPQGENDENRAVIKWETL